MPTSRFESCLPVFSNKAISNCALETFHTLVTLLFPYTLIGHLLSGQGGFRCVVFSSPGLSFKKENGGVNVKNQAASKMCINYQRM